MVIHVVLLLLVPSNTNSSDAAMTQIIDLV